MPICAPFAPTTSAVAVEIEVGDAAVAAGVVGSILQAVSDRAAAANRMEFFMALGVLLWLCDSV